MFDEKIVDFVNTCYASLQEAEDILKNDSSLLTRTTTIDETPLVLLIRWYTEDRAPIKEYINTVKLLLDYGSDVNANSCCGINPLHLAISSGQIDIVKLLLEHNADINILDGFLGQTTLQCAIMSGNIKMLQLLIDNGVDIDAVDDFGQTALHSAVENDEKMEFTKFLIACGANLHALDGFGNTPIHNSCYENAQITTMFLIENGADIYMQNERGLIPLDAAYKEGNFELYHKLIDTVS